jgi:hypothetical protein
MRKSLGIGLALTTLLALSAQEAFARHGGRMGSSPQGTRGGYGVQQPFGGGPFGAMQQYRMQNRARAMQCPYGNWLGAGQGQLQLQYGVGPGPFSYNNQLGAMQRYQMQHRARHGQGRGGNRLGTVQPQSPWFGVAPGQGTDGNQPRTMQQQRMQNRARLQQQD